MHNAHVVAHIQDTIQVNARLQTMYASEGNYDFLETLVSIQARWIKVLKEEMQS